MKILIASDIHGSAIYCEKLLDIYFSEKYERMILLGDILYHGPRNDLPPGYEPKKVIKMLNDIKDDILAVRGNCDAYVDSMVLEFPLIDDYTIMPVKDKMMYITHGHIYNNDNLPPMHKDDILLHGHTHIPMLTHINDHYYINPGSISIPKDNSEHTFISLENNSFELRNLDNKIIKTLII